MRVGARGATQGRFVSNDVSFWQEKINLKTHSKFYKEPTPSRSKYRRLAQFDRVLRLRRRDKGGSGQGSETDMIRADGVEKTPEYQAT
jgi:hypothetical protein